MAKLQSPNYHVSRSRLIIYNLPKSEKEVRKLCWDAVQSQACKQIPEIRQIKIMKDVKKGKVATKTYSRGVAFVEFSKHEHALVALRVLNNNPDTFGTEHRPIVEFALDDIRKMKLRESRLKSQRGASHDSKKENFDKQNKLETQKAETRGNKSKDNIHSRSQRNRQEDKEEQVADGNSSLMKRRVKTMKNEKKIIGEASRPSDPIDNGNAEMYTTSKKRKHCVDMGLDSQKEMRSSRRKKIKSESSGKEHEDKLDKLIEQYQSRFSAKPENGRQVSRGVKKWFMT